MRLVAALRLPLLYPTLHLTFHAESIDADPSAEDGTIFFFSLLLPLHFHKLYLLTTCSVQAMHFHTFPFCFVFLNPARSKLRMAMACLYLRLFTTRDIPVVA
jgi:hypothetical protein